MQINVQAATIADAFLPQQKLLRYLIMATLVAGGSAFVAGAAQVRIDMAFTPVPISGQTFAVLLVGAVLGSRLGLAAMLTYMAEGASGLPVFAGGTSGPSIISGPTGGYIIGFVFAAFVVGWLAERGFARNPATTAAVMVLGNIVIYVFGVIQLHYFVGWEKVWAFGVRDFIPGDVVKVLLAAGVLPGAWWLRERLGGLAGRAPAPPR